MSTLYFKAAVDAGYGIFAWEEPGNWFTDASAATPAANAPWVDGVDTTYLGYDLTVATGETRAPTIDVDIGTGVTGSCDIAAVLNNSCNINGGTFTGDGYVNNGGNINGGTWTGAGFTNGDSGTIIAGTFSGSGFYNAGAATISGGDFSAVTGFVNSGSIEGGTAPTYLNLASSPVIYFMAAIDNSWSNAGNWDLANGGYGTWGAVLNAPWVDGTDTTYLARNLTLGSAAPSSPFIEVNIGTGATGSCDIGAMTLGAGIGGGTFSGAGFINDSYTPGITAGTFTGDGFQNVGNIQGGTFSGSGFVNGDDVGDPGYIDDGVFSCAGFSNLSGSTIYGGDFSAVTDVTNSGNIAGGTPPTALGIPASPATVYFTGSVDQSWSNAANWSFVEGNYGAWSAPANAPWVDGVDSTYLGCNLVSMIGAPAPTNDVVIGTATTGTCYLDGMVSSGTINAGNFQCFGLINDGSVYGGNFVSENFNNNGVIYGGNFLGQGFYNASDVHSGAFTGESNSNTAQIYGGTFAGDNFYNAGLIYGGTFTGAGFANDGGWAIYGGTFGGAAATYVKTGNSILAETPYGVNVQINLPQLDVLGTGLL